MSPSSGPRFLHDLCAVQAQCRPVSEAGLCGPRCSAIRVASISKGCSMSATTLPNATLTETYRALTPGSATLAAKARTLMPSGLAHDGRHFDPYPLYVQRAMGPVKWDVDNNRYVDYFGGHGALILGHNHPTVMAAAHAALEKGTHFGA